MKAIVVQVGARHNYAVPRMLHARGALEALYTDSCANKGLGRVLDHAVPLPLRRGKLGRLLNRRVVGVPASRIRTADSLLLTAGLPLPGGAQGFARHNQIGRHMSWGMRRWGLGDADLVYSMSGEGMEFLRYAKERGRKVAIDMMITPVAHRIVREERARFPEWEDQSSSDDELREERIQHIIEVADLLTCPGHNVLDGLRAYPGFDERKARVVPYGCGYDYQGRVNQPVPRRVLFAGTADLRKGIHYLAEAAQKLRAFDPRYEVRVAGSVSERVRSRPECADLTLLGRVSQQAMMQEFLTADVLVLPTLAEGSASVVYEALAVGAPTITTRSAGSIVRDGVDGVIIPERDAMAITDAVIRVCENRGLRQSMSEAARESVSKHSEPFWADRLCAALAGAVER